MSENSITARIVGDKGVGGHKDSSVSTLPAFMLRVYPFEIRMDTGLGYAAKKLTRVRASGLNGLRFVGAECRHSREPGKRKEGQARGQKIILETVGRDGGVEPPARPETLWFAGSAEYFDQTRTPQYSASGRA